MSLCSSPYSHILNHSNSLSLNPEHCSKSFILLFKLFVALWLPFLFEDTNDEYEKVFSLSVAVSAIVFLPRISCVTLCGTFLAFFVSMVTHREVI